MAPKKPIRDRKYNTDKSSEKSTASKSSQKRSLADSGLVRFFKNRNTYLILGLIILSMVVFVSVSFVSYMFTGAADKSILDNNIGTMLNLRGHTANWTSFVGAVVSDKMIAGWFGLSSITILIFVAIFALRIMGIRTFSIWKSFFNLFFWLLWVSIFLSFVTSFAFLKSLNPSFFSLGGGHGDYIVAQFGSFFGSFGTFLMLLVTMAIYLIVRSSRVARLFHRSEQDNGYKNSYKSSKNGESAVAIGTEIVPEDWVSREEPDNINEEECENEPKKDSNGTVSSSTETVSSDDNVEFEITTQKEEESIELTNDDDGRSVKSNSYNLEELGRYDPTLDLSRYEAPSISLLKSYSTDNDLQVNMEEQKSNKEKIITTLKNFGIDIESIKATVGPTITLYEIVPKSGIRISKIRNLESDIMLSLAATGIRIIAPIPGKGTIGIEVPNNEPQIVSMRSVLASRKYSESKYELPVAFGKTITNEVFMIDLAKMPHLLVAGATGQGKSVGLNALITSLLYKKHPAELKFVLIDPKKVEFNIYEEIEKHFLAKLPDGEDAIITDTSKVVQTLNSLTVEMDQRYSLLKKAHVRNVKEYNEKFINRQLNPEKGHKFLPYIVVIVDEFGDLIMTAGKEVEMPIARIAQLARAVGIHMVIATQRPSVNIITGVIKANFPARVAFRVSSMMDSRTILDAAGANQLVGRGDMLFSQGNDLVRVQCAFVDTPEVENIATFIGDQRGYPTAFYLPEPEVGEGEGLDPSSVDMTKRDPMFEEAARLVVNNQQGSTSMIQRKFSIGYNRAGRIMDQLEVAGVVGAADGSKPRQVLMTTEFELDQLMRTL